MCPAQTAFSPVRRLKAANARRAGRLGYRNPIIAQHGIPWIKARRLELASIRTDPISNLQSVMGESSSAPAMPSLTIAAPESRRKIWGPTTSGPFYTGTAEVEPMGSWYLEPYLFDSSHGGSSSKEFNQKMAIGMGHNLEFDIQTPMILNTAKSPTTPMGKAVSQFGTGDTHMNFKYELTKDADTCKFLAQPAMTLTFDFIIPSGNASGLRASRYGVDQFGNGTYQEGLSLLIRKRARPFMFYGQFGDLIGDPTTVSKGYVFNNGIGSVQSGRHVRMVDGNLLYYSAALEYVLNTRHGIGLLAELDGQSQSGHSLFFGKATAPSYSYLSAAPEVEFTWPARKNLAITWGAGVNLPVERGDYPRTVTPMFTVSFNFNGPNGGRSSQ